MAGVRPEADPPGGKRFEFWTSGLPPRPIVAARIWIGFHFVEREDAER